MTQASKVKQPIDIGPDIERLTEMTNLAYKVTQEIAIRWELEQPFNEKTMELLRAVQHINDAALYIAINYGMKGETNV